MTMFARRVLTFGVALFVALSLAGCATRTGALQPANKTYSLGTLVYSPDFPNQAIVVVGLRQIGISDPTAFGYAMSPIDGNSIDGRGEKSWSSYYGSGRDFGARDEARVDYHVYKMPPGNYAATWISHKKRYLLVDTPRIYAIGATRFLTGQTSFQKIDLIDPMSTPETPLFAAKASEVVYIGDLVVDFSNPDRPTLTIGSSVDGARAALAEYGEKRPVVERPMLRPTGRGPRPLLSTIEPQRQ
ncbi:MAG: hypothetical protein HY059_19945 [Proteobacteria bacterium]|nr:hypothetical protein [Pseudomonadota bacterium]